MFEWLPDSLSSMKVLFHSGKPKWPTPSTCFSFIKIRNYKLVILLLIPTALSTFPLGLYKEACCLLRYCSVNRGWAGRQRTLVRVGGPCLSAVSLNYLWKLLLISIHSSLDFSLSFFYFIGVCLCLVVVFPTHAGSCVTTLFRLNFKLK